VSDIGQRHVGPTGLPCISVTGYARAQVINPKIYEHILSISNACSQPIKLQACYYKSQSCLDVQLAAYGRKEVVIGIYPSMREFRYEYRERF
jgi:hypothetical protein